MNRRGFLKAVGAGVAAAALPAAALAIGQLQFDDERAFVVPRGLEADAYELPGFIPVWTYASRVPLHNNEIGTWDQYRVFVMDAPA